MGTLPPAPLPVTARPSVEYACSFSLPMSRIQYNESHELLLMLIQLNIAKGLIKVICLICSNALNLPVYSTETHSIFMSDL